METNIQSKKLPKTEIKPRGPQIARYGPFYTDTRHPEKYDQRLREIGPWFTEERIKNTLAPLVDQSDRLSLRALDWLVINYSKTHAIVIADPESGSPIHIHGEYQTMLNAWKKCAFDSFRRRANLWRLFFDFEGKIHVTTLGQLNFLRWASSRGIIDYARTHIESIEKDMASTLQNNKLNKKETRLQGKKRKRAVLSRAPQIPCLIFDRASIVKIET